MAGGIFNPAVGNLVMGSLETGVTLNGKPAAVGRRDDLHDALVMASRSEVRRGENHRVDRAIGTKSSINDDATHFY